MKTSQETDKIFEAINSFKKSMKVLKKTKTSADGSYKYVTLDDVISLLKTSLHRYGLGFVQTLEYRDSKNCLETTVYHSSGQYIQSCALIPDVQDDFLNSIQSVGSNITYMRRYALCTIFGIVSEDDTDGTVSSYTQEDKALIEKRCADYRLSQDSVKKVKDMVKRKVDVEVILRTIESLK